MSGATVGAAGAMVSIVTFSAAEAALTLPARSSCVTVIDLTPSVTVEEVTE